MPEWFYLGFLFTFCINTFYRMLKKDFILKKKRDFERVFDNKKFSKNDFFYLIKADNKLKNSRFGFVVSSKVFKKSTERNLTRRRLKAIIKKFFPKIVPGFDIVIGVYSKATGSNFKLLEKKLKELLIKTHLFLDDN